MKGEYTTNSHYLNYILIFEKVGRMYFLNLGVKGLITRGTYGFTLGAAGCHATDDWAREQHDDGDCGHYHNGAEAALDRVDGSAVVDWMRKITRWKKMSKNGRDEIFTWWFPTQEIACPQALRLVWTAARARNWSESKREASFYNPPQLFRALLTPPPPPPPQKKKNGERVGRLPRRVLVWLTFYGHVGSSTAVAFIAYHGALVFNDFPDHVPDEPANQRDDDLHDGQDHHQDAHHEEEHHLRMTRTFINGRTTQNYRLEKLRRVSFCPARLSWASRQFWFTKTAVFSFEPILHRLSLPRLINFKFSQRPHQEYCVTQYENLGFS